MEKKDIIAATQALSGAQLAWNSSETVTVRDLEGNPIDINVRGGMPLTDIFDLIMEVAGPSVSEGHYNDLFGDMIMAQAIIDRLTDIPLPEDPGQMEIDQCYELVFGYDGIIRTLNPDGPARFLIDRILAYTKSVVENILRTPFDPDDADDEMDPEVIGLEELKKMRKN